MSALSVIDGLLVEAEKLIKSRQPPPTRGDYAEALERMDAAMELIAEGGCSAGTLGRCAAIQRKCNAFLRRSYSRTESYEKLIYERAAEHKAEEKKGEGAARSGAARTRRLPRARNTRSTGPKAPGRRVARFDSSTKPRTSQTVHSASSDDDPSKASRGLARSGGDPSIYGLK